MSDQEKTLHRYVKSLRLDDQPNAGHRDWLEGKLLT